MGPRSCLAGALLRRATALNLRAVHHNQIRAEDFEGVDYVINFAIDPQYMLRPYAANIDFDRFLGNYVRHSGIHYIMLSTRKVYEGTNAWGFSEEDRAEGQSIYGRNKVMTENYLRETLGSRLTILRLSNIIGYSLPAKPERFMARVLSSLLRTGRVEYDFDPSSRRDFLPDEILAASLVAVARALPSGVFNLGAGAPFPCGKIAEWVIEGYGSGELVVTDWTVRDEFYLKTEKIQKAIGVRVTDDDVRTFCHSLGRRLAAETH